MAEEKMMQRSRQIEQECAPTIEGYYWATHREFKWRAIVQIRKNGFGHLRAFAGLSSSFDVTAFVEWSEKICDPRRKPDA